MQYDAPTQGRIRSASPASSFAHDVRVGHVRPHHPDHVERGPRRSRSGRWPRRRSGRRGRPAGRRRSRNRRRRTRAPAPIGVPEPGMTWDIASSVAIEPLTMLRKSIVPGPRERRAISTPSASVRPPGTSSPPTIRMPTMKSAPTAFADRLEHLDGEAQPVGQRAAVRVVALVDERRPELVDAGGRRPRPRARRARPPCTPGRRGEGGDDAPDVASPPSPWGSGGGPARGPTTAEIVGSQSPSSQTVRRPRWVSWTIVARAVGVHPVGQLLEPRDDVVVAGVAAGRRPAASPAPRWSSRRHRQRDAALRLLLVVELVAQLRLAVLGVGRLVGRCS